MIDVKVFGGPSQLADGRDFNCYTIGWYGSEPPTAIELGGVTYLAVTEPNGKAVRRDG